MRFFRCGNCGALARTGAEPGGVVVCPNCNSRQTVPADAILDEEAAAKMAGEAPEAAKSAFTWAGEFRDSPRYLFLAVGGYLLMGIGPLVILIGIIEGISVSAGGWSIAGTGILNGLLVMGFGQLLHAVRDLARNSWRE